MDLSTRRIEVVAPNRLHEMWPFLRRGVEIIIKKAKPDWIAEDVYAKLAAGGAAAYILSVENVPLGFTVAMLQDRLYGRLKDFVVWCGWALPLRELIGLGIQPKEAAGLEDNLMEHMRQVAISSGCASVLLYSPRPGMRQRAAKWGFKTGLVRYDLEIRDG